MQVRSFITTLFIFQLLFTFTYANGDFEDENTFDSEFTDEYANDNETSDPLEGYNRFMTSFNDKTYTYVLNPTAKVYSAIVPEFLRIGISNAVDNIKFPIRFANNLLQLKFENATTELERFVVNSTIGLGGLMDPADKYMDLKPHHEDFGQTLGYYGVKPGMHIVLPFVGPSNVRDSFGLYVDDISSPLSYTKYIDMQDYQIPNNFAETTIIYFSEMVNYVSLHQGEYESLKKDSLDWYIFLRDSYEEHRVYEISK